MIVLVGPDRCGKTSVSKAISKIDARRYYYHHTKPPKDDPEPKDKSDRKAAFLYFARYFMTAYPKAIVDRCHWCEVAYGNTYREGSSMTEHQFRIMEMALLAHRATVIYLWDYVDKIEARWSDDEMFKFDAEKQSQLMEHYDDVYHASPVKKLKHRLPELVTESGDPTKLLVEIVNANAADIYMAPTTRFNMPPTLGIGSTLGGTLLLGESPGEPWSGHIPIPFAFGYSSEYIWSALDEIQADWSDIFIANASSFQSAISEPGWPLAAFCAAYNFDKIIAFGGVALTAAKETACDVVSLTHPHYARRFKSKQREEWVEKLRSAL